LCVQTEQPDRTIAANGSGASLEHLRSRLRRPLTWDLRSRVCSTSWCTAVVPGRGQPADLSVLPEDRTTPVSRDGTQLAASRTKCAVYVALSITFRKARRPGEPTQNAGSGGCDRVELRGLEPLTPCMPCEFRSCGAVRSRWLPCCAERAWRGCRSVLISLVATRQPESG
jgi:hypothetical protein